ncbi:hypothetical protein NHX12_021825 [Muraenolepis orangiensis]|uniref:Uncharacterized protein n=1 Tax=Muraenolepis orangiensis TaxID=630683 RepID=A0A9Q0EQQ2_9TELE|nr:hypothetical protein NHX12_021825 [Muraenolepis orangiensis]
MGETMGELRGSYRGDDGGDDDGGGSTGEAMLLSFPAAAGGCLTLCYEALAVTHPFLPFPVLSGTGGPRYHGDLSSRQRCDAVMETDLSYHPRLQED